MGSCTTWPRAAGAAGVTGSSGAIAPRWRGTRFPRRARSFRARRWWRAHVRPRRPAPRTALTDRGEAAPWLRTHQGDRTEVRWRLCAQSRLHLPRAHAARRTRPRTLHHCGRYEALVRDHAGRQRLPARRRCRADKAPHPHGHGRARGIGRFSADGTAPCLHTLGSALLLHRGGWDEKEAGRVSRIIAAAAAAIVCEP